MQEDKSKTLRQEESIQKWRNAKGIGTLLLCPRFGKTRIGVTIVNRAITNNSNIKILILTPSDYITRLWKSQFNEDLDICIYSIDYYTKNFDKNRVFDLVIVDEIHKFLTDIRYNILLELKSRAKWWLSLLGLMPHEKNRDMIIAVAPVIDEITQEEAIYKGWISPFIEYNVKLELSDIDKTRYIKFTNIIKETLTIFDGVHNRIQINGVKVFDSDFDLIYACYSGKRLPHNFIEGRTFRLMTAEVMGWYPSIDITTDYGKQRNEYWNPNAIYERCKNFTGIIKFRNEILANNDIKLNAIKDLIDKYPIPTIIFNESIDFVTKIANILGKDAIAYHSKIESRPIWNEDINDWIRYKTGDKKGEPKVFGKDTIRDETIKGIISGKYKYLITAKALDEGLTIPNLEQVIITAGSTNPIQQGQRIGRGLTIDNNNSSKQTKIFNLYFDDIILDNNTIIKSRDKTKLLERQSKNAIEITMFDEIS